MDGFRVSRSNIFGANPDTGKVDTITPPLQAPQLSSDKMVISKADGTVEPSSVTFEQVETEVNASQTLQIIADGGGVVLDTGNVGYVEVPFDCVITKATVITDQVGDITVDIWKDTFANYPPTNAQSITGGNELAFIGNNKANSSLTNWSLTLTKGDIICFNIDTAVTVTKATISLSLDKT